MKSAQAKRRHADALRLRAAELRQRADRIWPRSSYLTILALVKEAQRAALALEAAADLIVEAGDLVDELHAAAKLVAPDAYASAPLFRVIKHPSSGRAQDKRTREDE